MANYFEIKVKRTHVNENNAYQTDKEMYLVDALTYTEAEARIAKGMEQFHTGDSYSVLKIQGSKITKIHAQQVEPDEDGAIPEMSYFKVKCLVCVEIEGRKKPKKLPLFALIKALTPEDAVREVDTMMESEFTETDFELVKVEKTKFVGVIVLNR